MHPPTSFADARNCAAIRVESNANWRDGFQSLREKVFDGAISGDAVNWKVSITNPMPLTLEFIGKVSGDSMSGEMGIGPMGSFPFTGTRA